MSAGKRGANKSNDKDGVTSGHSRILAFADDREAQLEAHTLFQPLLYHWPFWAGPGQLAPHGKDWRVWLMLAGRGFGKTRAGAEWVRAIAEADGSARIALVGATRAEVRQVMIEGASGILSVSPSASKPGWEPTRGRLSWRSGAQAWVYSGEKPDGLRGPQFTHAWCDEIAKWAYPQASWDNLAMALRLGGNPRALVTTTPRPMALLRRMAAAPTTRLARGRTSDNVLLPQSFLAAMAEEYGGTRLGRQELDGELIDDAEGALWTRDLLEKCRRPAASVDELALVRVVVGVDPPAGGLRGGGDACGIVVAGVDGGGIAHVIEDASIVARTPEAWARAVVTAAARHGADRVVAEANNGGQMVESVLRAAEATLPIRCVHASRGKAARAEPVATLYEAGRVCHRGLFAALEDEMCGLIAGGGYEPEPGRAGRSPDRADALVWALTELMLGARRGRARVRVV